jgi:MFS family permease
VGGGERRLLGLAVHDLPALMAAMFLAGLGGSARGITMSALLDHVGHRDAGTESFASMVSAQLLGSSGGYSGGGALVGMLGPRLIFFTVAAASAAVALWAVVRQGTLEPAPPLPSGRAPAPYPQLATCPTSETATQIDPAGAPRPTGDAPSAEGPLDSDPALVQICGYAGDTPEPAPVLEARQCDGSGSLGSGGLS